MLRWLSFAVLVIHTIITFIAFPYARYVYREAKADKDVNDEIPGVTEEDCITAELRLRNSKGVYYAHLSYLITVVIIWILIAFLFINDDRDLYRILVFWCLLIVGTSRSVFVQLDLLYLSYSSARDRKRMLIPKSRAGGSTSAVDSCSATGSSGATGPDTK